MPTCIVFFLAYAELFDSTLKSGTVIVRGVRLEYLPLNVVFVAIELRVGDARTTLVITNNLTDPPPGSIRFSNTLYGPVLKLQEVGIEEL